MSVMIFGILNIGFAIIGFVSLLVSRLLIHASMPGNSLVAAMQSESANSSWANFSAVAGGLMALVLLTAGVGLLLMQPWARVLSIVHSVLSMIFVIISAPSNHSALQSSLARAPGLPPGLIPVLALAGTLIAVLVALVYPVLLLWFMTRPNVVAAFEPERPQPCA
jgi:hypothetical protein